MRRDKQTDKLTDRQAEIKTEKQPTKTGRQTDELDDRQTN